MRLCGAKRLPRVCCPAFSGARPNDRLSPTDSSLSAHSDGDPRSEARSTGVLTPVPLFTNAPDRQICRCGHAVSASQYSIFVLIITAAPPFVNKIPYTFIEKSFDLLRTDLTSRAVIVILNFNRIGSECRRFRMGDGGE